MDAVLGLECTDWWDACWGLVPLGYTQEQQDELVSN